MDRRIDSRIGIAWVVGGLLWLYGASLIHHTISVDPIGEAGFPVGLGILFVVGGAAVTIRSTLAARRPDAAATVVEVEGAADEPIHAVSSGRPMLIAATCFGWIVGLEVIGFLLATPVFLAVVLWLLEFRRPVAVVALALGLTVGLFVVVDVLLSVNLPGGPLAPITDRIRL